MSQPFIGEVRAASFGVIPRGWAPCNGQMMSIAQNQALFSILGTTYGGDGVTTFALPNLQGRVPVGQGNGVVLGESAGATQVTLTSSQLPAHNHTLLATSAAGAGDPDNQGPAGAKAYGPAAALTPLSSTSLGITGGSLPHDNMQPYLTVNFIIALVGIYPSRS